MRRSIIFALLAFIAQPTYQRREMLRTRNVYLVQRDTRKTQLQRSAVWCIAGEAAFVLDALVGTPLFVFHRIPAKSVAQLHPIIASETSVDECGHGRHLSLRR
eukprot:gnl/MRDRNA2_/MRDRNA2_50067_c0_seq1.p2 gnl/MRDRNA2_/MRDRNA2_50067_c0~~gnl/MRDRNA2_/MRDRNA2_50067_c0_seq1.p2  ORF type:complete len:103 (-),score=5.47 gnl/MRDRNA2_/MRDRNA2_50067_c0_seq1:471-779(-)